MTNIKVVLRGLNNRIMTWKHIPPSFYKVKIFMMLNTGCVGVDRRGLPGIQSLKVVYLQLAHGQCHDTTYMNML